MKKIFISHSTKDKDFLKETNDNLLRAGFKPWIDPAPKPGLDWRFEIDEAIRESDALIIVVTPNSMKSIYITYEWSYALGAGVRVIPIIFKKAELHPRLMTLDRFDYLAWKNADHFWDYFVRELYAMLNVPIQPEPVAAPPPVANAPVQEPRRVVPNYSGSVMPESPGQWLVVRRGPNLNQMFLLDGVSTFVLGRDSKADFTINDPEISRQHIQLTATDQGYLVQDLGSTNGTFVNGHRIVQPHVLQPGDVVALGDAIIITYEWVQG